MTGREPYQCIGHPGVLLNAGHGVVSVGRRGRQVGREGKGRG